MILSIVACPLILLADLPRPVFASTTPLFSQITPRPAPVLPVPGDEDGAEEGMSNPKDTPFESEVDETTEVDMPLVTQIPPEQIPMTEATFLSKLHDINQVEIRMGQLGMAKGNSRKVKALADRLFRDHRLSDRETISLADSMSIDLNTAQTATSQMHDQANADRMFQISRLRGQDFDKAFLQMMEEGHRDAVELFLRARNQIPIDSRVRTYASRLIPVLRQHLNVSLHLQENQ